MKAETKLARARVALVLDQPFFGTLALRLVAIEGKTKTMATDGRSLFWSREFVDECSPDELIGVVAHEVMHCAMTHQTRRGGRDPRRWNAAADYAINPILLDAGFTLPKNGLVDPTYRGMAAEQIYARLGEDSGGNGKAGSPGDASDEEAPPGAVYDTPGDDDSPGGSGADSSGSEAAAAAERRDWETAVLQAAQTAKAAGNCPGFAAVMAKAIRAPEIDWRDALRRFLIAASANDYSWRRPNHRHLATGDYLPSLYSESCGEVLLGIDTSGSVSDAALSAFASEVNAIVDQVRPAKTHVIYCDAQVQKMEEYGPEDLPIALACVGRGGTLFAPVFAHAAAHGIEPVCAVYLTDLECHGAGFGSEPGYPVLWVSTAADKAPFGEVVRLRV